MTSKITEAQQYAQRLPKRKRKSRSKKVTPTSNKKKRSKREAIRYQSDTLTQQGFTNKNSRSKAGREVSQDTYNKENENTNTDTMELYCRTNMHNKILLIEDEDDEDTQEEFSINPASSSNNSEVDVGMEA